MLFSIPFGYYKSLPEAHKNAWYYFKLKIPKDAVATKCEEHWSFTGEGLVEIVFVFNQDQANAFTKHNRFTDYSDLPINIDMPIGTTFEVNSYISPNCREVHGKYKYELKCHGKRAKLIIYDTDRNWLYAFYFVN